MCCAKNTGLVPERRFHNLLLPGGLGGLEQLLNQGGTAGNREFAPITGDDYRNWADGMRDVEELIEDPELRAEAARIRESQEGDVLEH